MEEESVEVGATDDVGIEIDNGIDEDVEGADDDAIKLDEATVTVVEVVVAIALDPVEAAFVNEPVTAT